MARKNPERDQVAAAALVKWKTVNEYSDGQIAKMVGRSAAAVATWRNGTRPMGRERDVLKGLTGWHWDNPPGDEYTPVKGTSLAPKAKRTYNRRPTVDSVEALILANDTLTAAVSNKRALVPKIPNDAHTMRVCVNLLKNEVARRKDEIEKQSKTSSIRDMILGHRDPKEALRFLREHSALDASILDAVERSLPVEAAAVAA